MCWAIKRAPDDPGFDRILRAAARNDFPVNILFWMHQRLWDSGIISSDQLVRTLPQSVMNAEGHGAHCRKAPRSRRVISVLA
jgi:hypothetical protein